jgi:sortase A
VLRADAEDPPSGTRILGPETAASRKAAHPGLILRVLGTLCLAAALVVGGYLGWLFWGTGVGTAREQRHLRQQISERIAHPRPLDPRTSLPVRPIRQGAPVGILRIPRIHLDMIVVNGTSPAVLKKGPGHYIGTAYPWETTGRVAIAGHRTTYLHPFWSLDKLRPGDLIRLVTEYGTFDYHVTGSRVIVPTAGWVLNETPAPTLVLTTCTPRFSASHRLVVFASR